MVVVPARQAAQGLRIRPLARSFCACGEMFFQKSHTGPKNYNMSFPALWLRLFFRNYCLQIYRREYTVKKKVREFPVPSRDHQTLPNDIITELFLQRGNLVSDIPAGDGKLVSLFLRCRHPWGGGGGT